MKKITVMFTALVLFTTGSLFAQSRPTESESMTINYGKITYNPASAAKDLVKNRDGAKPAAHKPAVKPKPGTKIAQPKPGTKASADYLLTLEPVNGESKD